MEILCGILFGAINVAFFLVGYYWGSKKKPNEDVVVDDTNKESVKKLMEWMNFGR